MRSTTTVSHLHKLPKNGCTGIDIQRYKYVLLSHTLAEKAEHNHPSTQQQVITAQFAHITMSSSATLQDAVSQLESGQTFLTTGGLETTLMFRTDFDLRNMASFETLFSQQWSDYVTNLLKQFGEVGIKYKKPFLFDTDTWRASKRWYDDLGLSTEDRERVIPLAVSHAVQAAEQVERASNGEIRVLVQGVIGPRADAYVEDKEITVESAREYHREQVEEFKAAGVTVVSAMTLTTSTEAVAIAKELERTGLKCIISFTTETEGMLPSGEGLGEAIERVEREAGDCVLFYMVNCVYPSHVRKVVEKALEKGERWVERFGGIRGNASAKNHEELDESVDLDEGVPEDWAKETMEIRKLAPGMKVLGGCCGTGVRHCEEIAKLLT